MFLKRYRLKKTGRHREQAPTGRFAEDKQDMVNSQLSMNNRDGSGPTGSEDMQETLLINDRRLISLCIIF